MILSRREDFRAKRIDQRISPNQGFGMRACACGTLASEVYVRLYAFDEGCSISFDGDGDGDGSDDDGQLTGTDDIIGRCG